MQTITRASVIIFTEYFLQLHIFILHIKPGRKLRGTKYGAVFNNDLVIGGAGEGGVSSE